MKLSEMRQFLHEKNILLTKSLGQNFLHDQNQLDRIVAAAHLTPMDKVLEIGPGLGPLTERLLQAGHVLAIEKDARLIPILKDHFATAPHLELLHADALEWLKENPRQWQGWKLVANLPYSVGSPILVELALAPHPPEKMVATLQWEVVQRLAAARDTDSYGLLTLLVQLHFQPGEFFKIPRGCFFPEPDVDSACIVLTRRATPLLTPDLQSTYVKLVKQAFSQRRKMMMKLLKCHWPEEILKEAFQQGQLDPQIRAEKVTVEQFAELTTTLAALKAKK